MAERRQRAIRIQEPTFPAGMARRPLLGRVHYTHSMDGEQFYSCHVNPHSHLPVYTNIHRIRRDVISIVEDYLSFDQLRDLRLNLSVVRPLVDKLYKQDDISIVYSLLINRSRFLEEQAHMKNRQNVQYTRAILCELAATRILRRYGEDNPGPQGLLLLAHILVAGFEPFQNAPPEVRSEAARFSRWDLRKASPALEIAIVTESKYFLSSTNCQRVIDAIYTGHVIYTPSTFLDLIPDRYKQKPISLYDPRSAPLLNQYRLVVPRTRNYLEVFQFILLLGLYLAFMFDRNPDDIGWMEICFSTYAFGWVLDQFATILEHGWRVYTQNLWSFLDVAFVLIYWVYVILRVLAWASGNGDLARQALDILAIGAPILVPRLAFNLLSDNLIFLSLRFMIIDFTLLTFIAVWCFVGFLLSMVWLAEGRHDVVSISKWMLWIWFGLDATGVQKSGDFHWLFGPVLMVTFAFLGNTLFLTILVSMLSNTFSTIVASAASEIHFRRAVLTLEGLKADAIFAYQPPFNILAVFVLIPMRFIVSPRWFHKIHVGIVKIINLPILLFIAIAERRLLWSVESISSHGSEGDGHVGRPKRNAWFWERWRITTHRDMQAVFEIIPPDSVEGDIAVDDELTHHMIRRQFVRQPSQPNVIPQLASEATATINLGSAYRQHRASSEDRQSERGTSDHLNGKGSPNWPGPSRRDSISILNDPNEIGDLATRMDTLETTMCRIEDLLESLTSNNGGMNRSGGEEEELQQETMDAEAADLSGHIEELDRSQVG